MYNNIDEPCKVTLSPLYIYVYDTYGNIRYAYKYTYSTATYLGTDTYGYTNTSWLDRLTSFNGANITYDAIGNPLSYNNGSAYTFTWQNGRDLASVVKGGVTTTYKYGADGQRIEKKYGSTTYNYYYADGLLVRQTWGTHYIDFLYDESGSPYSLIYDGVQYYYIKNVQGDVVQIRSSYGTLLVEYTYDAWGNVLSITGSNASVLGANNPIRYRSYYYDFETGFYYLNSRYYDPAMRRFINADDVSLLGANADFASLNLYAYCGNNPIMRYDPYGYAWYHTAWNNLKKMAFRFSQTKVGKAIVDIPAIVLSNVTLEGGICIGMDIGVEVNGVGIDVGTRMDILGFALEDGELKFGHFGKSGASVSAGDYSFGYESNTYESFNGKGDYRTGMKSVDPYDKGWSIGKSASYIIGYHYNVSFSLFGTIDDIIKYFE